MIDSGVPLGVVRFTCHACNTDLEVDVDAIPLGGALVECPTCSTELTVPEPKPALAPTEESHSAPDDTNFTIDSDSSLSPFEAATDQANENFSVHIGESDSDDFEIPDDPIAASPPSGRLAPAAPGQIARRDEIFDVSFDGMSDVGDSDIGKAPVAPYGADPASAEALPSDPLEMVSMADSVLDKMTDDFILGEPVGPAPATAPAVSKPPQTSEKFTLDSAPPKPTSAPPREPPKPEKAAAKEKLKAPSLKPRGKGVRFSLKVSRKQAAIVGFIAAVAVVLLVDPFDLKLLDGDDAEAPPGRGAGPARGGDRSGAAAKSGIPPEKELVTAEALLRRDSFGEYMQAFDILRRLTAVPKAPRQDPGKGDDDKERRATEEARRAAQEELAKVARVKLLKLHALVLISYGEQVGTRNVTDKDAEDLLNVSEKERPRDPEYAKAKAALYIRKKNFEIARENLSRAATELKRDAEISYLRGLSYAEQARNTKPANAKDRELAAIALKEAIALDPTYGAAHFQLGRLALAVDLNAIPPDRAKARAAKSAAADAARIHFRNAATATPTHVASVLSLAEEVHLNLLNDRAGARHYLNFITNAQGALTVVASPDELGKANLLLGRLAREDGDAVDAKRLLEAALASTKSPALRIEIQLTLAAIELERREWRAAIAQFDAVLKNSRDDVDALLGLAHAELALGMPLRGRDRAERAAQVIAESRKRTDLAPDARELSETRWARALTLRGRALAHPEINRTDEAILAFRTALETSKPLPTAVAHRLQADIFVHYVELMLARKSYQAALDILKDAAKVIPDSLAIIAGFGDVYFAQNNIGAAEEAYRKVIAKSPAYVSAHFNLARLLRASDRLALALVSLETVKKLDPQYPGLRLEFAMVYQRQKRPAESIGEFNAAIKESPKDVGLLVRIARAHFDSKVPDGLSEARRHLNSAILLDPAASVARFWRARVLLQLAAGKSSGDATGLRLEADQDLKHAAEKVPGSGEYRYWAARCSEELGNSSEALFHYEEATKLLIREKNDVDLVESLYRTARLRFVREELPAAKSLLDQVLTRTKTHVPTFNLLGDYYLAVSDNTNSIATFSSVIALSGGDARAYVKRAQAYMRQNMASRAVNDYRAAARLDPKDPEPHLFLGRAAKLAGQTALAIRELETYMRLFKARGATEPIEKAMLKEIDDEIYRMKNPIAPR